LSGDLSGHLAIHRVRQGSRLLHARFGVRLLVLAPAFNCLRVGYEHRIPDERCSKQCKGSKHASAPAQQQSMLCRREQVMDAWSHDNLSNEKLGV
jgi:hypothetical protein